MKLKKFLCLLMTIIITIGTFSSVVTSNAYFDGTTYYSKATKTTIGNFTYILKENVQYGYVKFAYSATVTGVPNIQKVEIPQKVKYDNIEFTITDIDLEDGSPYNTNYRKIKEIVLPETIYNITSFSGFINLTKMNMPKNTVIGREDINYTDEKPNVWLSNLIYNDEGFSEANDGTVYFCQCPKLKLSVDANSQYYKYENDILFSKDGKIIYMSFNKGKNIIIPTGVKEIRGWGNKIFGIGFPNAKTVKLPDTLTYLGYNVFADTKIKKIVLPDSLKSIGESTFSNSNLKTVRFGNSLKVIKRRTFKSCKNLRKINLPKRLEKIETASFKNCKNLSKVVINNKKKSPKIEKNAFKNTPKGIKFYVKNKKVAKSLKKQLKGSGVRNAKILIGSKVIYKNVK